jgi:hypothetical protein
MAKDQHSERESQERKDQSSQPKSENYGSGTGSSGPGKVRVQSHTPENRLGEMNPSAPTESTEGPSTNLAKDQADGGTGLGAARPGGARDDEKASTKNEGTLKSPSGQKSEAA